MSGRFPKPQKFDEIFSTNLQEPSMEPPCWEFKGPSDFDIDINNLQTTSEKQDPLPLCLGEALLIFHTAISALSLQEKQCADCLRKEEFEDVEADVDHV